MAVVINQNIPSLTAQRYLGNANSAVSKSMERLSSGLRINSASDDASGLAISEKLRGQISGLKRASMNAQDGISMLQTAEGGLQNVQDMLQRMRELSVQASNGIYTSNDRAEIQKEVDQLKGEIDRVSTSTEFNTKKLLNGDATALWSTNSDNIEAIVRGPVAEGNYDISVTVDPGQNEVYKTDIMTNAVDSELVEVGTTKIYSNSNDINASVSDFQQLEAGYYSVETATTAVTSDSTVEIGSYGDGTFSIADFDDVKKDAPSGYFEVTMLTATAEGTTVANAAEVTFYNAESGEATTHKVNMSAGGTLMLSAFTTVVSGASTDFLTVSGSSAGDKYLFAVNAGYTAAATTISASGGSLILSGPEATEAALTDTIKINYTTDLSSDTKELFTAAIDEETGDVSLTSFNVYVPDSGGATPEGEVSFQITEESVLDYAKAATITDSDNEITSIANVNTLAVVDENGDKVEYKVTTSTTQLTADATSIIDTYKADDSSAIGSAAIATGFSVADGAAGYIEVELLKSYSGGASTDLAKATYYSSDGAEVQSIVIDSDGSDDLDLSGLKSVTSGKVDLTSVGSSGYAGDKILFTLSDAGDVTSYETSGGNVKVTMTGEGLGTSSDVVGPTIEYKALLSGSTQTLSTAHLTDDGELDFNTFDVTFAEGNLVAGDSTFVLTEEKAGELATLNTKLENIDRFTTDDGVSVFSTQELTIFGNDLEATIYIEGTDTIGDLENKLTSAIVDQLGMGSDDADVNEHLVDYISTATAESDQAVAGTFVIQSAFLGEDSKLSFVGDQKLIDALSIATIQEGSNSSVEATITDAHTGEEIGSDTVNDGVLRNIIKGIDVEVSSTMGVSSSWDDTNKEVDFAQSSSTNSFQLHVVDNSTELQIGANQGQTVDVSIGQVDVKSLNLEDVLMVDQELAQDSIKLIDRALETVSGQRATIGAQINRLEYTITGLDTTRENLAASESRIRDLDIADEMAEFTKQQILSQSSTAMLSQANQLPQMALQLLG